MINQFKSNGKGQLVVIKITDNKGIIFESFSDSSAAGKSTTVLASMQSLKAQAMAKVLVEEGIEIV